MFDIPLTYSAWERLAKERNVYGKSISDFERIPSASKMEEATFLSLKVL